jgi:predicted regulator of Ras-like GTPase activity (Roadblock/LC7/MglB family)
MAFKEHLKRAVTETPGALMCTLMGNDGIAVDTFETERSVEEDIATSTIELTSLLGQVRASTGGLKSGSLKELVVGGQQLMAIVRPLTDDYFLALLMDAQGNTGKARYLLRVISPRLVEELA